MLVDQNNVFFEQKIPLRFFSKIGFHEIFLRSKMSLSIPTKSGLFPELNERQKTNN